MLEDVAVLLNRLDVGRDGTSAYERSAQAPSGHQNGEGHMHCVGPTRSYSAQSQNCASFDDQQQNERRPQWGGGGGDEVFEICSGIALRCLGLGTETPELLQKSSPEHFGAIAQPSAGQIRPELVDCGNIGTELAKSDKHRPSFVEIGQTR